LGLKHPLENNTKLEGEENKAVFGGELKTKTELDKLSKDIRADDLQAKLEPKFSDLISAKDKMGSDFSLNNFQSQLSLNNNTSLNNTLSQQITNNLSGTPLAPLADQLPKELSTTGTIPKSFQIETPVGQGTWSKQFNDQVVWMGTKEIKAASIRLTPLELGPVEINLKISNDIASIQFNSHSPQVRELIEQALPKLREQLSEQGIELTDADVNDNSNQQSLKNQDEQGSEFAKNKDNDFFSELKEDNNSDKTLVSEIKYKAPQGLVDYLV
jgi:flagellar hook-length control protein FliK